VEVTTTALADDSLARMSRPAVLPRTLGFREGLAVLVGIIIGSGIFRGPGKVLAACGTPGWTLTAWIAGGVLSFIGALVVAELCARLPRAGGTYAFLKEAWGAPSAFAFAVSALIAFKPLAIAGIARVCGEHALIACGVRDPSAALVGATSVGFVAALTLFNIRGVRGSARLQVVATVAKAVALGAVIVAAWWYGDGGGFRPVSGAAAIPSATAFAGALAAVLWAYDGWADLGYLAGEVKEPARVLPRLFAVGLMIVAAFYLAANLAYLSALPPDRMAAGKTVAVDALSGLLGSGAAVTAAAAAIAVSTFGALNASILSGGRIPYAAAADGLLPAKLARLDAAGTPTAALAIQGGLSAVLAASATFEDLADAFIVTTWAWYVPMAIAAVKLRRTAGAPIAGNYAMPWYPWPVVVFVVAATLFLGLRFAADPLAKVAAGFTVATWVVGHLVHGRIKESGASNRGDPRRDLPEDPPVGS